MKGCDALRFAILSPGQVWTSNFCGVGASCVLASDLQLALRGYCMDPSFDSVIRHCDLWQPVQVHREEDFNRWDDWSACQSLPTICWQLGSLERNLVVYTFLDLHSVSNLRAACFVWAVELCDNQREYRLVCTARRRNLQVSAFLDTLVGDPPVQN